MTTTTLTITTTLIIIIAVLTTLCVILIAYWVIQRPITLERMRLDAKIANENKKVITPAKMSAYERLTLLMERVHPEALVMRMNLGGHTVTELQTALLASVREEFEHNVSQQLYVSDVAWEAVCDAREAIVNLINHTATKLNPQASDLELAEKLISTYSSLDDTPTDEALDILKAELRKLNEEEL